MMTATKATLFEHATIISYDNATKSLKTLRDASLLVEDGRITQLAEGSLPDPPSSAEVIDATNKIISPGFINTHHHMWMSAFRTIAANTTLAEYLTGRYVATGEPGKHFTPEDVYLGQLACALEFIDGGTTTILDHAHSIFSNDHVDAAVNASYLSGLRIYHAHSIQEIKATNYTPENAMTKLFWLAKDSRFTSDIPLSLAIAYDGWAFAPAKVNQQLWDSVINHNNDTPDGAAPISLLTSHYVGGPFGANNSPELLDSFAALNQPNLKNKLPIIFSHASFMSDADASLLRQCPHASISTTPESEAHYGHTSPGADACQDCASLGVDTHFTFSSFMPTQARLWLQHLRYKHYDHTLSSGAVPANNPMHVEAAFLLMTQKGGVALGRNDIGVIDIGAQADLVLIDTTAPAMWAARDPVAAVVLHACAGDVEGVMVQGKWLKRNGKIAALEGEGGNKLEVEDVRKRFEKSAKRTREIWDGIDEGVNGEKFMGGAKYGTCERVNVRRGENREV